MIAETPLAGGTLLDYTHPANADPKAVLYASVSSPDVAVRVVVRLNGVAIDVVWVGNGSSHSWWGSGNAGLLPGVALMAGDHVVITASGQAALRVDL